MRDSFLDIGASRSRSLLAAAGAAGVAYALAPTDASWWIGSTIAGIAVLAVFALVGFPRGDGGGGESDGAWAPPSGE